MDLMESAVPAPENKRSRRDGRQPLRWFFMEMLSAVKVNMKSAWTLFPVLVNAPSLAVNDSSLTLF